MLEYEFCWKEDTALFTAMIKRCEEGEMIHVLFYMLNKNLSLTQMMEGLIMSKLDNLQNKLMN